MIPSGVTYYFVNEYKEAEINSLVEQHDAEIDGLVSNHVLETTNLTNRVTKLEEENNNIKHEYANIYEELNLTKAPSKYHLHDPTEREVLDFIEKDKTDEHTYSDDDYVCFNYASDVDNNAGEFGIRCGVFYFYSWLYDYDYEEWYINGHAMTVFDTSDNGRIYIDYDDEIYYSFSEIEDDWGEIETYAITW